MVKPEWVRNFNILLVSFQDMMTVSSGLGSVFCI